MQLAIFDLDNTLLGGDSDDLWGEFLVAQGVVDRDWYAAENRRHYEAYEAGTLDIQAFLDFALKPLADNNLQDLLRWREQFMQEYIEPILLPAADTLLAAHRAAGDQLLIITATNSFITAPIAERLGVDQLLATEPEQHNGRYTGRVSGTPCFQAGKVTRLQHWLAQQGPADTAGVDSIFYSDSHNDLPLLRQARRAVAVDPDPVLTEEASHQGWPIITLRDGNQPRYRDSDKIWQP